MKSFALLALVLAAILLFGRPAGATFGCTVIGGKDGFALLHADPDDNARVIRKVPHDAMVSLIDHPPKPAPKGWSAVKHDKKGNARWGVGTFGWMHQRDLNECG